MEYDVDMLVAAMKKRLQLIHYISIKLVLLEQLADALQIVEPVSLCLCLMNVDDRYTNATFYFVPIQRCSTFVLLVSVRGDSDTSGLLLPR